MQHRSKKQALLKNLFIKKIIAFVMLMVFAFSITPTIIFHNWLANHTDAVQKTTGTGHEQVGKKLFNCHCDNIVAESPFTYTGSILVSAPQQVFSSPQNNNTVHLHPSPHFYFSLRGPPVV